MSHKIKDGIVIDNSIYMMDDKRAGFPVFLRCLQLLAVLAGSYATISILIDCLALPILTTYMLMAWLICGILIYLMLLHPSYDLIKLIASAVIYLAVWRKCFEQLKNGFYILENAIIDQAASYYGTSAVHYKAHYSTAEEDITLLIILILIPMIALLAYAIIRSRLLIVCDIILLLPVASSFALGITPSEINLLIYILTMVFLSRSYGAGLASYKEQKFMLHRINSNSALVLTILVFILFQIMKLAIPEEKYRDFDGIETAKSELQDFLFNFSWEDVTDKVNEIKWLPSRNSGNGGLNSGKLGRVDRVSYDETEQLTVSVPLKAISEGMYLKGFAGAVYTGDSWEGHSQETMKRYQELQKQVPSEEFQPVNVNTAFLKKLSQISSGISNSLINPSYVSDTYSYQYKKGTIEIEYETANKNHIYAPYLTDFEGSEDTRYEYDLYAAPVGKDDSYEYDFYFSLDMDEKLADYLEPYGNRLGDYSKYEKLYRSFVHEVYTELPDEGLDRLKSEFTREKIGSRVDTLDKAVSYVKDYLQNNAQYTLSPGKLPKDKDFVEYFIYENKVGYCSHFASAGVLMLRSLGYPARYAEGYAIGTTDILFGKSEDNEVVETYSDQRSFVQADTQVMVSVKDYCAHAWAEVYVDGFGWFPVEFTPGAGVENTERIIGEATDINESITEDEEPSVTPTVTPEPTEPPAEDEKPTATPTAALEQKDVTGTGGITPPGGKDAPKLDKVLLILLLTAIPITLLSGYLLLTHRRKKQGATEDRSRKALFVYCQMEKLLTYCGAMPKGSRYLEEHLDDVPKNCSHIREKDFKICIDHVRKARFGRNTISERELKEVETFYEELRAAILRDASVIKRAYVRIRLSI